MSFPLHIVEKFRWLWGETRATQQALARHIGLKKVETPGMTLGGGTFQEDLASQEELVYVKLVAMAGGYTDYCWTATRMTLTHDGAGSHLAENEDDADPIVVVPFPWESFFPGCIGLARFAGLMPQSDPDDPWKPYYTMINSMATGLVAYLMAPDPGDQRMYTWSASLRVPGCDPLTSNDLGLAFCRDSQGWDPQITAPRKTFPLDTKVVLHWEPSQGGLGGRFWFAGTPDPDHGVC